MGGHDDHIRKLFFGDRNDLVRRRALPHFNLDVHRDGQPRHQRSQILGHSFTHSPSANLKVRKFVAVINPLDYVGENQARVEEICEGSAYPIAACPAFEKSTGTTIFLMLSGLPSPAPFLAKAFPWELGVESRDGERFCLELRRDGEGLAFFGFCSCRVVGFIARET